MDNGNVHISIDQALAYRLRRQNLLNPEKKAIPELVAQLSGVQSQVHTAAELAIGLRNPPIDRSHIRAALLEDKTLIKSSCMRETLHIVPANEFSIFIRAQQDYRLGIYRKRIERYGLAWEEYEDFMHRAQRELLEQGPMTRPELLERILPEFSEKLRQWSRDVWGPLRGAVIEGMICYGPEKGNKTCFAAVSDWHSEVKPIPAADSKKHLLKTYLHAYGPVTRSDFSHWMGMPKRELEDTWEDLGGEIVTVEYRGSHAYILGNDLHELQDSGFDQTHVCLLPYFDNYTLAHADKTQILDQDHYKQVFRTAGWVYPVVLVNGRVKGVWKPENTGINIEYFSRKPRGISRKLKSIQKHIQDFNS